MSIFPKGVTSYNSRFSVSARQFFLPSRAQFFMYILVSSLVLIFLNGQTIWNNFKGNLQSDLTLSDVVIGNAPVLQKVIDQLAHSRVPEIVFWLMVGCGVYIIVWFIRNISGNVINDVVADSYLHPKNYSRWMFWQSVIARKILFFFCIFLLIVYVFTGIKFLPAVARFFYSAIDGFSLSPSIVQIIISVFITSFVLYLFILLVHLTVNLWRLVYRNL